MAPPPKPPRKAHDPFAEFDALAPQEQALREGRATPGGPAAAETGGWFGAGDPYERMVNKAAAALGTESFHPWLRTAGRVLIPQNSVEAALMAVTLPLGGLGGVAGKAAGRVAPWAGKALGKVVGQGVAAGERGFLPLVGRAAGATAKGAAAGGLAAGATGHDIGTSTALGGIGGGVGQLGGEAASAALQIPTVKGMASKAGETLQTIFGKLTSKIPGAASAGDALRRVINGEDVDGLTQEIWKLGQKYQTNPKIWDPRKDLDIYKHANIAAGAHPKDADKILDPMGVPSMQGIWKYGTPEARKWLIDSGYMLTGAGEAKAYRALAKELDHADLMRRWVTGVEHPAALTDEQMELIEKRLLGSGGTLTPEGVNVLARRAARMQPELRARLGTAQADELAGAVFHEVGQGLKSGTPGAAPSARVSVGKTGVHPGADLTGARIPSLPGWEQEASKLGKAAVLAVKPELTQGPAHLMDRPAPPAPPPAPPPPILGTPPPADRPADRGLPVVEPPPMRPEPPSWFKPDTATAAGVQAPAGPATPEELEVNLDINKAP